MNAIVFGNGKIARGFIGQLLYRSGYSTTFVGVNRNTIDAINAQGKYYVNVMGNPSASQWISDIRCIGIDDIESIAQSLLESDVAFMSVGGKNIDSLGGTIAEAINIRPEILKKERTLITCENWKDPHIILEEAIRKNLRTELIEDFGSNFGITQAAILRSGVEPTEEILEIDKFAVSVTNYWELPVDASRVKGSIILEGLELKQDFGGFLQQKIYTFNTGNATIAYTGSLYGEKILYKAANDKRIVELLNRVYAEINPAIAKMMDISIEEQNAFSRKAIDKYQDKTVMDFTERHARDPIRKLGPNDRMVGTARLVEKMGFKVDALAETIAAAIYYCTDNENDPSAAQLKAMREEGGAQAVLMNVCGISPEESLGKAVLGKIEQLKEAGVI